MNRKSGLTLSAGAIALGLSAASAAPATIQFLDRYESGVSAGAEIAAFDPLTKRVFVTNGDTGMVDVVDAADPSNLQFLFSLNVGGAPTSVSVENGVLAVAVNMNDGASPGEVRFYSTGGAFEAAAAVGYLPDQVTLIKDGRYALVANEGEPKATFDPEGSIAIVDRLASGGPTACFADFKAFDGAALDPSTRLFPGKPPSVDFEPEYTAYAKGDEYAYATLQEANSIAEISLKDCKVTRIFGLGYQDHSMRGAALDPSDRDGGIRIANWPVKGIRMPDGVAAFKYRGETYFITANEGDDRGENARLSGLMLDTTVFPNATTLKANANLGRLNVSTIDGDTDNDGALEEIYSYGARSFSIFKSDGTLVYDSGDEFEKITATALPAVFNASNDDNSLDSRSDNKGPEPEGVAVGKVGAQSLAFIGLERIGGVMVYDVSVPTAPAFCSYVNTRDFSLPATATANTDNAPEGLDFVKAEDSPTGAALLFVAHEASGTVAAFSVAGGDCGGAKPGGKK